MSVRWTTAYLKRLLIERHAIRAKLENPGGSVIVSSTRKAETEAVTEYSHVIGNDYHLDLLDAEKVVNGLPSPERVRLLLWCDGLSPTEAAQFASVRPAALRKSRERTTKKIVEKLNEEDGGPEDPR
jgi:DNA-directed RNA polymerase specialized sigma24 family protein